MKTRYLDLIEQTFAFPQPEFKTEDDQLFFHDIPMMELVRQYGTPFKFTYLQKISENIQQAKKWFQDAMKKADYKGRYVYCYCTKSNHFFPVLQEALKNRIDLEASAASDISIIRNLYQRRIITEDLEIVCNGFKTRDYLNSIADLVDSGFHNVINLVDNDHEIAHLLAHIQYKPINLGIRIAAREDPKFEFYTSRLGIGYKDILPLYHQQIRDNKRLRLKMLHFFIDTGIRDTVYYWNELFKCLRLYADLKKICPELTDLNIGGGFPIKDSLAFKYNYEHIIIEIIARIKDFCRENQICEPNLYTEFGSYTVGESSGAIFKILGQKKQNDWERWNMIDGSFITALPDCWALNKRFLMLPLNRWSDTYERVLLGGLTCDGDDYYNSEQHVNAIYLPRYSDSKPLYIGFFNTGAYQDSLGGTGGIHHCLLPHPKHILIRRNASGALEYELFIPEQKPEDMLKILGY